MCVAKDELELMLRHQDLRKVPFLFYSNKSDVPKCWTALQCAQALQLDEIKVTSTVLVASYHDRTLIVRILKKQGSLRGPSLTPRQLHNDETLC